MNSLLRKIIISLILTLLLVIIHVIIYQFNYTITDLPEFLKNSFLYNGLFAIPFYLVNAYLHEAARKREQSTQLSKPVFWGRYLVFIITVNVVLAVAITYVSNLIDYTSSSYTSIDVYFFLSTLFIATIIGGVFYSYFLLKARFAKITKTQKSQLQDVTQKHEALKTQVGPHFLFNSLNVLSGLVEENPVKAQDFIANLAHIYRYVLDQKNKKWVPIAEEIQFAHIYLELVQTRFENGFIVSIDDTLNDSEFLIAPLTLQLLLENCIKHNTVSKEQPLNIEICQENQQLIVKNNLNAKKLNLHRTGTGLQHLIARYKEINEQVAIVQTEKQFIVNIPLVTKKTLQMRTQENYSTQELQEAREEVKERMGFYANLISYIIVSTFLVVLNLYNGGYFWAIWPIMGWGIGVISHGLGVFYFNNRESTAYKWQERQARKLLEKRKNLNK